MDTLAPTFVYRRTHIRIATERVAEFIDLTDGLSSLVNESAMTLGVLNVHSRHETAAIVVSEYESPEGLTDSACLSIVDGHLLLGEWQRVFLVELDGPQLRDLSVVMLGESGR